jgi:hypothetical protein
MLLDTVEYTLDWRQAVQGLVSLFNANHRIFVGLTLLITIPLSEMIGLSSRLDIF